MAKQTTVSINGGDFHINGQPTYAGRTWNGHRIEGLLMNARFVQATFDDLSPETRDTWKLPDGSAYDAVLNTQQFVDFLPTCREHGLLAFTLNMQGGNPRGYGKNQPWHNSAFEADGTLRDDYRRRFEQIIDAADSLGMVVVLGLFYFGQDERLADEAAVVRATDEAIDWLVERGDGNVVIEIANECDIGDCDLGGNFYYEHAILRSERAHELVDRVRERSDGNLLASTSYRGDALLRPNVAKAADYILLHGNSVEEPAKLRENIRKSRDIDGYRGQPIVINEDDHFAFDQEDNNLIAAVSEHVGWGLFDYRMQGEPFEAGYQSVPTDWSMDHRRKRGFFEKLAEITGARG